MKLYLQILIIGLLVFSSNSIFQYSCLISNDSRQYDGFYNAPIGAGGICTNTGVCQGQFSENANYPASTGTLTGDCFHCNSANNFLDREKQIQNVRCSEYCQIGYTDSSAREAESSPLKGNCQYCVNGLVNRNGVCECQNEGEYLINSYSGTCGTKCDEGYVQFRDGVHLSEQNNHCLYCHSGLENKNGVCACPINGQYLTQVGYAKCGQECDTNFTDNYDGSAPNSPLTGHCFKCITGHTYYNKKCSPSCPTGQYYISFNPICGTSCEPGYSDKSDAPPSTPIEGNCGSCLRGLYLSSTITDCNCRLNGQYLTSITSNNCGRNCLSGYTYNSDGRIPDSPSKGHCLYCLAGLQKNNNNVCKCAIDGQYLTSSNSDRCGTTCDSKYTDQSDGSSANSPLTGHCFYCESSHSMFQGFCYQKCKSGQYYTQSDGSCGTSCVNGHTDQSDGSIASSTLKSDCKYCVRGLVVSKENGVGCQCQTNGEYLTSIISESCGTTCDQGYTDNSEGREPATSLTGHCLNCVFDTHTMYKGQCQTNCASGQYYTQFDGTCGTVCATGYTDQSDGSTPTSPLRANCQYCLSSSNYYLNKPRGICSLKCVDGYTYRADGYPQSSLLTGDCSYCLTGLKKTRDVCQCAQSTLYLISRTDRKCSDYCAFPFTYQTNGTIADKPNRGGHCLHCIAGLEFKNGQCRCTNPEEGLTNPNSGVCGQACDYGYTDNPNGVAPTSPINGHCRYCIAGLSQRQGYICSCIEEGEYLTSLTSGRCGKTCVFGYTDKPDGSDPNSPTTGHCRYCLNILEQNNLACDCPISAAPQYLISSNSKTCGTTCEDGFTDQSNGGAPDQPLTGHCLYQRKCQNDQYITKIDGNCGTGTCVLSYTDQSDGSPASNSLTKDCKYCLKGLENKNGVCECTLPFEYLTNIKDGICGTGCLFGYTHFSFGYQPLVPSLGHCIYCLNGMSQNNEGYCV